MMGFQVASLAPRLKGMRRGTVSFVLVALLLMSGVAYATPVDGTGGDADGPSMGPIPVLSLSLFPSQLQARVTQSQLGAVTFGGNATVEQMFFMSSKVTLTAVVNTGWPVVLSPQTIEFTGSGTEQFQVTVIVPPATSAMLTGNVIVTGQCKAPGLSPVVAAASAVVTVAPYYGGRIESKSGNLDVDSGEAEVINVTIYNDGNGPVEMRVYALEHPDEVRISFSETQFNVQPDEFVSIDVEVEVASGAGSGAYPVLLVAEAQTRDGSPERVAAYNLTVYVPSIKAKLGFSGMVSIILVCVAVATVVVLWRIGYLSRFKGIRLRKRSTT